MEHHLSSNKPFGGLEPPVADWLKTLVADGSPIAAWFERAQDWENEMAEQ